MPDKSVGNIYGKSLFFIASLNNALDNYVNQGNNKLMAGTRLIDYIYAAHRFLSEMESVPRDYGTGEKLFATEIHTVVAIDENPGCNLTTLATVLEVSKPAVSKFVAKLIGRGFITKYQAGDNRRDVLFETTMKGKLVTKGHALFTREAFEPLLQVERELDPQAQAMIEAYFRKLLSVVKSSE
jgi:DNA-binding MarR family transcriptional regulator